MFCNSICSDRSGMAASRFLAAAAACGILLSFAAESRKIVLLWQKIFLHFDSDNVSFKVPLKKCFKIVLFPLRRRDLVLELQFV